jgi:hypothetical protein
MDWLELKPLLDRLEDTATPREVISIIRRAKKVVYFDGGFADYIRMIIAKDLGIQPKLSVVPPIKRILLDPFLDQAYVYFLKGAFNHRKDVDMFEAYCSPLSDKYGKYLDEMSVQQRKVFSMMNEDIIAYKRKVKDQGTSMIEDALNDTIRKQVSEKGSDTTE